MSSPSFNTPSLELLGRLLPGYDFVCLIATGGMGAVYKAKQRSLARDVAIKILPPEVGKDPLFRQSFETEARAMAKLNHPNLIGVYDSGSVDGMLYIVMEYVPGKSLFHSSHGKKVDPVQAVQLVRGICAGLGHAHENGIIHRDIKPANILLTLKAEPKIGDFGLAHPVDSKGTGLVMGTLGYTAPEVVASPQVADRRSDLFAVGVILYELVTGQVQGAGAPPPSQLCRCGPGIDEIWRRATHPNPAIRYPDAQAFGAVLTEWLAQGDSPPKGKGKGAVSGAPPQGKGAPGAGPPGARPKAPNSASPQARPRAAGSGVSSFLQVVFIAGILALSAYVWNKRVEQDKKNQAMFEEYKRLHAEAQNRGTPRVTSSRPQEAPATPTPTPVAPRKQETPTESLERLSTRLASGARTEMPVGTMRRGNCDFCLVSTPMTWAEAAWHAERCGGHLAIPTSTEDLSWFGQYAPPQGALWIGAGKGGHDAWSLVDGTLWKLPTLPTGTGSRVGVSKQGRVGAVDSNRQYPFLIQWHRDGSNPATLDAALLATRNSLKRGTPVYPPGTETIGNRNYLYVARPVAWRDAVTLAEKSGGHLVVAASSTEATSVAQVASGNQAPKGIWLGGLRKKTEWFWVTGEAWQASNWAKGAAHFDNAAALFVRPDKTWDAQDASVLASGFIIEWSNDH